jgi:hypothetical protein
VVYATPVIINHKLIVVGATLAVRDLAAGPADRSSWRANGNVWAGETGRSGVTAGQPILLASLDIPLVDLLAGP